MKIEDKKVVVMTYELEVDGKIVDSATAEKPLDYIQGMHMLIPKLESTVAGLDEGAAFSCTVLPEEGYGEYDKTQVIDVPKDIFIINGELCETLLQVGKYIPMLNSAGEVCQGMVVEVKSNDVTMDFNLPMAGKTLNFTGTILSVRDATEKELTEGLHGEFLPQESCGHCHDFSDEGCCHHHGKHGDGCCHGGGHHHEDGECHCHGDGHHHGDGGCCCNGEGHCHNEE